jgi:hypothetical protein
MTMSEKVTTSVQYVKLVIYSTEKGSAQDHTGLYFLLQMVVVKWTVLAESLAKSSADSERIRRTLVRSNGGEHGSGVTSVLGLRLGLDASNIRSRVYSLCVGALGGSDVFSRSNRLGDRLGFFNLDSLGNTRRSALGWLGSVTMSITESSLLDRFGER